MPQAKPNIHNEWFQPITSVATCPCGSRKRDRVKAGQTPELIAWGEYHNAKWRTVDYFCQNCFHTRVIPRLRQHAIPCGCTFALNARSGHTIPAWLTLPADFATCQTAA